MSTGRLKLYVYFMHVRQGETTDSIPLMWKNIMINGKMSLKINKRVLVYHFHILREQYFDRLDTFASPEAEY